MLIVYILPLLATITYEKNIKTVCSGFKSIQTSDFFLKRKYECT